MNGNLFDSPPSALPEELFEPLASGGAFQLERIVSRGHRTPPGQWYDQAQDEWVVLLKGAAQLRLADDDRLVDLSPGDYLLLPAHCRHRVEWTSETEDTLWLALHFTADARP